MRYLNAMAQEYRPHAPTEIENNLTNLQAMLKVGIDFRSYVSPCLLRL